MKNLKFEKFKTASWLRKWMEENGKRGPWLAQALGLGERHAIRHLEDRDFTESKLRKLSVATGVDLFVYLLSDESRALYEKGKQLEAEAAAAKEANAKVGAEGVASMQEQMKVLQEQIMLLKEMVVEMRGGS